MCIAMEMLLSKVPTNYFFIPETLIVATNYYIFYHCWAE